MIDVMLVCDKCVDGFHHHCMIIESLINGVDLSEEEAKASLDFLLSEANEVLISAFLILLRAKGESFEEFVGLARAMFKCCRKVEGMTDVVDIVGTRGDGTNTINISTGACILAAASGAKIAKQGNRSSSPGCVGFLYGCLSLFEYEQEALLQMYEMPLASETGVLPGEEQA
ncbi:anthranilate phosphoribosyltransferase, chloroplastic-like [Magnolia sinica]|uniref:anthranilate phosphoribosyltransferase, chloroplastic-like n=1 Tax=Magnolia sinica TaxID=86752 RepID=UPI00265B3766|nr:anthranilate phosphoribosyltransferase, chloroplastic-like [Magnolia sinica]